MLSPLAKRFIAENVQDVSHISCERLSAVLLDAVAGGDHEHASPRTIDRVLVNDLRY